MSEHIRETRLKGRLNKAMALHGAARFFDEVGAYIDAATMEGQHESLLHLYSACPEDDLTESTGNWEPTAEEFRAMNEKTQQYYQSMWHNEVGH